MSRVQLFKFGRKRRMIRTIRLTLADVDEAQALVAVDDEGRRPGDVEGGEPETVIDPIAFDHRPIRIDKARWPTITNT